MTGALLISLPLVFLLGMAIQRGNTCTVVAIDDIVHRRSWDRFLAIASAWFLVAGGLVLLGMATGSSLNARAFPVTAWSAAGGILLGVGAVVNGACTTGTIARIGSGEYAFLLTVVGFYLGCLISPHVFGQSAVTHTGPVAVSASLSHPVPTLVLFAIVIALEAYRLIRGPHESIGDFLRTAWDPRTAILIVAVLFVALVHIFGPWAYTELLGALSKHDTREALPQLIFLVAIIGGAVAAGKSMRGQRLIGPLRPKIVRCLIGGSIMGLGYSLAPGAFDGLTLVGQPLLLPYAWAVMAVCYVTVVLGVMYVRSGLGGWITTRRG